MTNFEKWKEEILKISEEEELIAVRNNTPIGCNSISCGECDFTPVESCILSRMEWLYREYREPIALTQKEYNFCKFLGSGYLSRSTTSGALIASKEKPELVSGSSGEELMFACGHYHYFTKEDQDVYSIKFDFIKEGESYDVKYLMSLCSFV